MLVAWWSCHPTKTGQGNYGEKALCQGPGLSLTEVLPWSHPSIISCVKNAGILFRPAKIKHWWRFPQNGKFNTTKICTPTVANGWSWQRESCQGTFQPYLTDWKRDGEASSSCHQHASGAMQVSSHSNVGNSVACFRKIIIVLLSMSWNVGCRIYMTSNTLMRFMIGINEY